VTTVRHAVYRSRPTQTGWEVTECGRTVSRHETQKDADSAAIAAAGAISEEGGLARVVLDRCEGTSRERTLE